jgi:hypothetical protein
MHNLTLLGHNGVFDGVQFGSSSDTGAQRLCSLLRSFASRHGAHPSGLFLPLLASTFCATCMSCGCIAVAQVLWGAADYGAKVVFSSHMWQKNLSTVQQRREAAQELMGALDRCAGTADVHAFTP